MGKQFIRAIFLPIGFYQAADINWFMLDKGLWEKQHSAIASGITMINLILRIDNMRDLVDEKSVPVVIYKVVSDASIGH